MKKIVILYLLGFFIAASLHALTLRSHWPGFFYVGFPGMAASLLLTGVHGGTEMQDRLAFALELGINATVYAFVLFWFLKLWKKALS